MHVRPSRSHHHPRGDRAAETERLRRQGGNPEQPWDVDAVQVHLHLRDAATRGDGLEEGHGEGCEEDEQRAGAHEESYRRRRVVSGDEFLRPLQLLPDQEGHDGVHHEGDHPHRQADDEREQPPVKVGHDVVPPGEVERGRPVYAGIGGLVVLGVVDLHVLEHLQGNLRGPLGGGAVEVGRKKRALAPLRPPLLVAKACSQALLRQAGDAASQSRSAAGVRGPAGPPRVVRRSDSPVLVLVLLLLVLVHDVRAELGQDAVVEPAASPAARLMDLAAHLHVPLRAHGRVPPLLQAVHGPQPRVAQAGLVHHRAGLGARLKGEGGRANDPTPAVRRRVGIPFCFPSRSRQGQPRVRAFRALVHHDVEHPARVEVVVSLRLEGHALLQLRPAAPSRRAGASVLPSSLRGRAHVHVHLHVVVHRFIVRWKRYTRCGCG
mmetsp:Transcript_12968/g.24554  ORF Transcript_12968/g.24554 Transcript_12968/m.24554 type:complete len:434 (-) Transcript_12968:9-1310(-)